MEENLREHCAAVRNTEGYIGDIVWEEGEAKHSTCWGAACMDGAGLTRAYNHRIKGTHAVFIVWSLVINKSIMIIHHQMSRIESYLKAIHLQIILTYLFLCRPSVSLCTCIQ